MSIFTKNSLRVNIFQLRPKLTLDIQVPAAVKPAVSTQPRNTPKVVKPRAMAPLQLIAPRPEEPVARTETPTPPPIAEFEAPCIKIEHIESDSEEILDQTGQSEVICEISENDEIKTENSKESGRNEQSVSLDFFSSTRLPLLEI